MNKRKRLIAVGTFIAAYAVAYEAGSWGTVYLLDWWDPKFGNQRGNIAFGRDIMTFFLMIAVLSFLAGSAVHWRWIDSAQPGLLASSSAAVAVLSHSALLMFSILTREFHGYAWSMIGGLAFLFGGPAASAVLTFGFFSRHRT